MSTMAMSSIVEVFGKPIKSLICHTLVDTICIIELIQKKSFHKGIHDVDVDFYEYKHVYY